VVVVDPTVVVVVALAPVVFVVSEGPLAEEVVGLSSRVVVVVRPGPVVVGVDPLVVVVVFPGAVVEVVDVDVVEVVDVDDVEVVVGSSSSTMPLMVTLSILADPVKRRFKPSSSSSAFGT
jgi:hypothetical protein